MQQQSHNANIITPILTGLILWQIVFRVNLEIGKGLFEELLSHNVVNLFSSPLTRTEWALGMMIMGSKHVFGYVLLLHNCKTALWH